MEVRHIGRSPEIEGQREARGKCRAGKDENWDGGEVIGWVGSDTDFTRVREDRAGRLSVGARKFTSWTRGRLLGAVSRRRRRPPPTLTATHGPPEAGGGPPCGRRSEGRRASAGPRDGRRGRPCASYPCRQSLDGSADSTGRVPFPAACVTVELCPLFSVCRSPKRPGSPENGPGPVPSRVETVEVGLGHR